MAEIIMMQNPATGEIKKGFMGFSWTVFFFGWIPMLFRGDWINGITLFLLEGLYFIATVRQTDGEVLLLFIGNIVLAFCYNKRYTKDLIRKGFRFSDSDVRNQAGAESVGMSLDACVLIDLSNLTNDFHSNDQKNSTTCTRLTKSVSEIEKDSSLSDGNESELKYEDDNVNQRNRIEQQNISSKNTTNENRGQIVAFAAILIVIGFIVFVNKDEIRHRFDVDDSFLSNVTLSKEQKKIKELESFSGDSDILPDGKLYEMFKLNSQYTDVQRENELQNLKGRMVSWECSIYEVGKIDDKHYIVYPKPSDGQVDLILEVVVRNEDEPKYIESLTTGSRFAFTGMFSGKDFMRSLILDPVILASFSSQQSGESSNKEGRVLSKATIEAFFIGQDEDDPEFTTYIFCDKQGVEYRLYGYIEDRAKLDEYKNRLLRIQYTTETFYFPGGEGMMKGDFLKHYEPIE